MTCFYVGMLALPAGVAVYLIIDLALARAWWGFQCLFGVFGLRMDVQILIREASCIPFLNSERSHLSLEMRI